MKQNWPQEQSSFSFNDIDPTELERRNFLFLEIELNDLPKMIFAKHTRVLFKKFSLMALTL